MNRSATKYKAPFFVLLSISVLLVIMLVINLSETLLPHTGGGSTSNIKYPTMEGEITDILHGTLYLQTIEIRTSDGSLFCVGIRPYTQTELIDSDGNPVLASGLAPGMRVKVTYKDFVHSPPISENDATQTIFYSECPQIQLLS